MGYVSPEDIDHLEFINLVSGATWLLRNGTSYVAQSAKIENVYPTFVSEAAPRTAIGHDERGRLVFVEV